MEEQPQEESTQGSDERPKIFKNVNGWIAGVTGAVIALGGLATAVKQFMPDKPAAEQAASTEAPAEAAPAQAAADIPVKTDEDLPMLYEGDGVKLEFAGDKWVLTDADGAYDYEEMLSPDEDRLLAFSKPYDSYLRWPIKGGWAEESTDDKQTWKRYAEFYPPEPAAE